MYIKHSVYIKLSFVEICDFIHPSAEEAHEETLSVFKQTLIKKHGNLVRAWRIAFASNDQLSIPKPQFLTLGICKKKVEFSAVPHGRSRWPSPSPHKSRLIQGRQ